MATPAGGQRGEWRTVSAAPGGRTTAERAGDRPEDADDSEGLGSPTLQAIAASPRANRLGDRLIATFPAVRDLRIRRPGLP